MQPLSRGKAGIAAESLSLGDTSSDAGALAHSFYSHHVYEESAFESVRMPLLSVRATRRLGSYLSTAMLSTATIRVVDEDNKKEKGGRPAHWTSDKPVWFQNPWQSWRANGRMDILSMVRVFLFLFRP